MALIRSAATIGSFTLLSRVFGFARDILTAAILGAGPVADAFFVAQRLPNLFRSLFAEGAFSAAFVPLASGALAAGGSEAARRFAEEAFAVLFAVLFVFVVLGEVFMPAVMHVIAPGFEAEPGKFALVVALTRITFPYLLFISLVALQGGLLNSLDRFAAAAATPILLNLFLIAALLAMAHFGWGNGHVLAWALTAAGIAQFLWLAASCAHAGVLLRPRLPRLTAGVRRTLVVMGPGIVGAGMTQINLLISTALASLLPGGSVSYLYYADRLNQLPLGVVGIAVATAILPPLSRQVHGGDFAGAVVTQNRGVELAILLTLPAAIGLAVLAYPILAVLFERGAFGAAATAATAAALVAYAAGLPAFVLVKVLAPGFFARQDTKTPVKIALVALAVNLGLTLVLMQFLAHVGIAIALSAAGWTQALALALLLARRGHFRLDRRARRNLPRIAIAAGAMGAALVLLRLALAPAFGGPTLVRLAALFGLIGAGAAIFAGLILVLGVAGWRDLRGRLYAAIGLTEAANAAMRRRMNRIFSGVQPTGNLHLGNYLGAIRNWVALQHDYECIFCIVDLHALTLPQDPAELRAHTREVTAAYIAAGIDPTRCVIFNQSMVSAHAELAWLLGCLTPLGWLNRMTQFKEKAGKQREMAGLGLYAYPVLMAADILAYKATHVPVGEDQKQHLELARDIAGAFNRQYGREFFPLPEPQIFGEATRVMSLRDGTRKMSKSDTSDYSRINMTDDADAVVLKIRRAKTDPEPLPETIEALEKRPEADNLVGIYAALAGVSREAALQHFAGRNFSAFKETLSGIAVEVLGRIGGEMRRLLADPGHIDAVLRHGAERAAAIATPVLREVQDITGLLRP